MICDPLTVVKGSYERRLAPSLAPEWRNKIQKNSPYQSGLRDLDPRPHDPSHDPAVAEHRLANALWAIDLRRHRLAVGQRRGRSGDIGSPFGSREVGSDRVKEARVAPSELVIARSLSVIP